MESDFIAEEDFRFLADAGAGLVLAPFNYRLFLDDQAPGKRKEEGFAAFERLFGLCGKYHLYVLPDLHTTPGGGKPGLAPG